MMSRESEDVERMQLKSLEFMSCPVCSGQLRFDGDIITADKGLISEGQLVCTRCLVAFQVTNGIPRMLHDSLPGIAQKRKEVEGWVKIASEHGWYVPDDRVDLSLPFLNRDLGWNSSVWQANEYSFAILLKDYIRPGMRVLELGAAKCWGAMHLVPRGCDYVATDILVDSNIGLGRGAFYASRFGEFERVQADGEHLPFRSGYFDLTYCCATLHHALDLPLMLREMSRVTRFGGLVIALNEGTRPLTRSGNAAIQQAEKNFGINEHVHSIWSYLWSFSRAGLLAHRIDQAEGYDGLAQHSRAGRLLRLPRGKLWATLYAHNFLDYGGISIFSTKLLRRSLAPRHTRIQVI